MGLYLPTNKKPRCCQECNWFGIKDLLECDPKEFFGYDIPKDCPIVEVKTPHGKLVDSEAVMDDIDTCIEALSRVGITIDADTLWGKLNDAMNNAEIVIKAEG